VAPRRLQRDDLAEIGKSKRDFLKIILAFGGLATLGSIASTLRILGFIPPPTQGASTQALAWPRIKLVNVAAIDSSKPLRFNYPLVDTPNVLLKVGRKAENGVGPESDIVAYSDVCQHLGCFYGVLSSGASPPCNSSYKARGMEGYCCCHGGQFDLVNGAKVIGGPPPRPVPAVMLEYDKNTGDIYAIGMGPPTIFGHGPPGTTDPALVLRHDLEGGEIVTEATAFARTQ
jgi:arsenite oxidase small subunit